MMYTDGMKFDWDPSKNEKLRTQRNITFEQVIFHLGQGDLWKIADHPNQAKYSGQRIFLVVINEYIHMVPYWMEEDRIVLKTIIPSRKYTKEYLKEREK
jgi:uncharacterized DUF497 family protein